MREPEVHRRQWVLGPEPVAFGGRWRSETLADGLVLSWHEALPVRRLGEWRLLGLAVATDPAAEGDPAAHAEWAGRWVLIGGGRVLADTGSLLGPYVRSDGEEARWASSSAAILAGLGPPPSPPDDPPLRPGEPMDWYAPPSGRRPGIRRLFAGQCLTLPSGHVQARPVTLADRLSGGVDEAAARLVAAWRGLADGGSLWLPLTSGHDSRLLLAAAVSAGVQVTTYTFANPDMSRADREQPPLLARLAGVEHRLIEPGRRRRAIERAFDRHCDGHHAGVDRRYLANGQWDAIPDDAVVVRGGVFETARRFYHAQLPATPDPVAAEIVRAFGLGPKHGARRTGVLAWTKWAQRQPWPGIDWRDRFYLEQRVGGWLAALEQSLDLAAPERIHIASCDALLGALLSIPEAERAESRHHEALIERLAPELLELPVNPPEKPRRPALATRARIVAGRWRRRLRGAG